ncbi:MAG: T9SS type A sorting domain-containing protein [Bacteroidota bacterium]
MKKIYFCFFSLLTVCLNAQNPCVNGRYVNDVYSTVTVSSSITYGSSKKYDNSTQILLLDFYQGTGDTSLARPLIVIAHGGSFFGGTKTDADMTALGQRFAKKGFAVASIEYRVGFFPFDSSGIVPALIRAVQDMKAAVRFFYKDKSTINQFKIDTNNIFIGGTSAGAITALHMAYLNKSCEINTYVTSTQLDAMGGLQGISGNQCYSTNIKGVINICGALGKYGWMEPGDVPLVSLHGTNDATVIYSRGKANPGIPMLYLDGSRMLFAGTQVSGINHKFYTWYGAGHVPYSQNALYMDTTITFVKQFLINTMGCPNTPTLLPNTPAGIVAAYAFTNCTTNIASPCDVGIKEIHSNNLIEQVYPNPSNTEVKIIFKRNDNYHLEVTDITGKIMLSEKINANNYLIEKNKLNAGIYILKVATANCDYFTQKLVIY